MYYMSSDTTSRSNSYLYHCKNKVVCLNPHKVTSVAGECAVTCSAIRSLYSGSQAKSFFFGETRNKICVTIIVLMDLSFLLKSEK